MEDSLTFYIISIFILLLFSAFFSACETGLTTASRAKIFRLKSEGNKRALAVSRLRDDKDKLLSTLLFGNNLVNIGASSLATAFSLSFFSEDGVLFATIIMTFTIVIFTEIMPKTYAFRNSEKIALAVAPIYLILIKIFSPIVNILQFIVDLAMIPFGIKKSNDDEFAGTEELRGAIEMHHDAGSVVKDERDMLDSILDLTETEVGEIMTHRQQFESINIEQPIEKIIEQICECVHTRIPFWKGEKDNIVGVLHMKDFFKAAQRIDRKIDIDDLKALLRNPWFIPETISLKNQLRSFLEHKSHFALVVDEYGVLQGLVTLEDVLEEIVGQIEDEHEITVRNVSKILKDGENAIIVDGTTTVRDVNRELDSNLPDDEASTIAGLIIHEAKNIPDVKQVFQFHGFRFEILAKKRNQITKIRISKVIELEEVTEGY